MAIAGSGELSLAAISAEMAQSTADTSLATRSTTNINTNSASRPDGSEPHAMSEFYNYDHAASGGGGGGLYSWGNSHFCGGRFGDPSEACAIGADFYPGFDVYAVEEYFGQPPSIGQRFYLDPDGTIPLEDGIYFDYSYNQYYIMKEGGVFDAAPCKLK